MMRPYVDKVESDPSVPAAVDIVVIGGGIVGCSAAFWAAEQGHRVALIEKGRIAGEQSSRNWGWVRRMGRAVAEYPLGIESLRLWDTLAQRTGHDTGFRRTGVVYTAQTDAEMAWIETVRRDAQTFGLAAQPLSPAQLSDRFEGASLTARAGLYTEDDGRAEPALAAPALARGARTKGATVLTGCAVRSIETKAGTVSAVITERGRIACSAVIVAGGAWSRLFLGNLGVDFPQLRVRGSAMRTAPIKGGPAHALGNGAFGIRPRLDGGYTIAQRGRSKVQITPDSFRLFGKYLGSLRENRGEISLTVDRSMWDGLVTPRHWQPDEVSPFEKCRVLDPEPQEAALAKAMRAVQAAFPALKQATITEKWGGIIDVTPDAVPVIDPVDEIPGLVIASGFSGHGFGIGPAAGQLAGELATGAPTLVDPTPFRLDRFGGAMLKAAE
jgi:glycine/D-amino acid oxidase-like deaminating enzyme